jgi:hypothetical protein
VSSTWAVVVVVIARSSERVGFEMSPISQFWIVGDLRTTGYKNSGVST